MSDEFKEFVEGMPEPEKPTALWDMLPEDMQDNLLKGAEYWTDIMNEGVDSGIRVPLTDQQAADLWKLSYVLLMSQGVVQKITGIICQAFVTGGVFAKKNPS
jgi:hypothetical protein